MRSRVLNGRGVSVSLRHRGFRAGGGRGYFLYIVILLKGNYFLKLVCFNCSGIFETLFFF